MHKFQISLFELCICFFPFLSIYFIFLSFTLVEPIEIFPYIHVPLFFIKNLLSISVYFSRFSLKRQLQIFFFLLSESCGHICSLFSRLRNNKLLMVASSTIKTIKKWAVLKLVFSAKIKGNLLLQTLNCSWTN